MPNLVVYVPTSLWNRIHEMGLEDPKVEARKVARGALESWLSERGKAMVSEETSERLGKESMKQPPRSENQPTPANCGMSNRHHMNSKQNPCPRCGYPA